MSSPAAASRHEHLPQPLAGPGPGRVARLLARLLGGYKRTISPLLPDACRFSPTCSEYARLAVLRHGAVRGLLRAAGRIARCQPLGLGGIDIP